MISNIKILWGPFGASRVLGHVQIWFHNNIEMTAVSSLVRKFKMGTKNLSFLVLLSRIRLKKIVDTCLCILLDLLGCLWPLVTPDVK